MSMFFIYQQWIKVGDFFVLVVIVFDIDYNGDGEIDMLVFFNSFFSCEVVFEVFLLVVEENCFDYEVYIVIVWEDIDSIFDNNG